MELKFKRVSGIVYAGVKPYRGRMRWVSMKTQDMREANRRAKEAKLFKMQAVESANALSTLVFTRLKDVNIPTVSDAIELFIATQVSRGLAGGTIANLRITLNHWLRLAGIGTSTTDTIKPEHFTEFFNPGDKTKLRTINARKMGCENFCAWLVEQGYLAVNIPASVGIDQSKLSQEQMLTKSHHPVTPEELERILVTVKDDPFWLFAVTFAWEHGLRIGDICQLEKINVIDGRLRLITRKTGTFVSVPLTDNITRILNVVGATEHEHEAKFLFPKQRAEYQLWAAVPFSLKFSRICRLAQVKGKSFHGLRTAFINRTYADRTNSILVRLAGEAAKRETATAAGHTTTQATDIYLRAGHESKQNREG